MARKASTKRGSSRGGVGIPGAKTIVRRFGQARASGLRGRQAESAAFSAGGVG